MALSSGLDSHRLPAVERDTAVEIPRSFMAVMQSYSIQN